MLRNLIKCKSAVFTGLPYWVLRNRWTITLVQIITRWPEKRCRKPSSIGARVDHAFRMIKLQSGFSSMRWNKELDMINLYLLEAVDYLRKFVWNIPTADHEALQWKFGGKIPPKNEWLKIRIQKTASNAQQFGSRWLFIASLSSYHFSSSMGFPILRHLTAPESETYLSE